MAKSIRVDINKIEHSNYTERIAVVQCIEDDAVVKVDDKYLRLEMHIYQDLGEESFIGLLPDLMFEYILLSDCQYRDVFEHVLDFYLNNILEIESDALGDEIRRLEILLNAKKVQYMKLTTKNTTETFQDVIESTIKEYINDRQKDVDKAITNRDYYVENNTYWHRFNNEVKRVSEKINKIEALKDEYRKRGYLRGDSE